MSDFEIKRTVKKDDIPKSGGRKRIDYSSLIKSASTLEKDEALEVSVEKKHRVTGIKRALEQAFKHTQFTVTQRTQKEGDSINVYIIREN